MRAKRVARVRGGGIALVLASLVLGRVVATGAAELDPGLVLELDLAAYRVNARDERAGDTGPSIPIALGSPANPTPPGTFPIAWVILRPAWTPGASAAAAGARSEAASLDTPMGVAKIPFARGGSIALHGGGDDRLLGQPISGGCVRAGDADLLRLIAWLDERGALGPARHRADGEIHLPIQRPARIVVH